MPDIDIETLIFQRIVKLSDMILLAETKQEKKSLRRELKRTKRIFRIARRGSRSKWQLVLEGLGSVLRGALP